MTTLTALENAVTVSLKAGQKDRVGILRMFVNTAKLIAKNDGNRDATDDDVLSAGNRMIKQARETRSFLPEGDERAAALDLEIATVEEFLPQRMPRDELDPIITKLIEEGLASGAGKGVRGYMMKTLNTQYRGQFDSAVANDILGKALA